MSELRDKRIRFSKQIAALLLWGNSHENWEVAFGQDFDEADPKEKRRHRKGSLHYLGLANDLALYIDGVYQTKTEAYRPLGERWKLQAPDNRWGGDFKVKDGNHFSVSFEGKA
jgi:hypothetical protein